MTEQEQMLRDDEERRRYLSLSHDISDCKDLLCANALMGNILLGALDALCNNRLLDNEDVKTSLGQINKILEDVRVRNEQRTARVEYDLKKWKEILERGSE